MLKKTKEKSFFPRDEIIKYSDNDWDQLNEEKFRKIFKDSPVKRTKHFGLKRNIKKNLI